ncbi:MAG: hypothetical protein OEW91_16680 [Acidimicrobiia bacterium]|nr:hypothetical protein [Acidimicrobiia bacterium]
MFTRPATSHDGTKTRRREIRRDVRRLLGTSSEGAPNLAQALAAADQLKRIIDLASGGRYGLSIVRAVGDGEIGQTYRGTDGLFHVSSQVHEPIHETRGREYRLRADVLEYRDY